MKHIFSTFLILILLFSLISNVFSYEIDGIDNGYEWDGATVYKLFEGESNCGIDFGILKYKFDYETSAVMFCFMFSDSGLEPDNINAGVSLTVESADFEFNASDVRKSDNQNPYSFDGAIYLDENNGATAEIRVGIKAGLPESLECSVRFIDSQGYYSNYYPFTIINNDYSETENIVIYSSENYFETEDSPRKTVKSTTKRTTKKRTTTEKKTITEKKTSSFTSRTTKNITSTKPKNLLSDPTTMKPTDSFTTAANIATIIYHEKEIYISHVYIQPTETTIVTETSTVSDTEISTEVTSSVDSSDNNEITLSQGTKYKKILTGVGLTAFIILAGFGIYSAKKNAGNTTEK